MKENPPHQEAEIARHSFIVRIWCTPDASAWQGWVQYVRTGEEIHVHSLGEIAAFIESRAALTRTAITSDVNLK